MEVYFTYKLSDAMVEDLKKMGLETEDVIKGYMMSAVNTSYEIDKYFAKNFDNYIDVKVVKKGSIDETLDLLKELKKSLEKIKEERK